MIRGLVPREKLLEWSPEDGWEPLCRFLDKPVPDIEFPHANAIDGGWKSREEQAANTWARGAGINMLLTAAVGLIVLAYIYHM